MKTFDPNNKRITRLSQKIFTKKQTLENDKAYNLTVHKAKSAIRKGKYKQAKKLLDQAHALKPQGKTLAQLRKVLKSKIDVDIDAVKNKLAKVKKLITAQKYDEASALIPKRTGNPSLDKAIKSLKRAIRKAKLKKRPTKKIDESFLAGISSYRLGNYKKALVHWTKVLKLDPNHKQAQKYVLNVKKKISVLEGK